MKAKDSKLLSSGFISKVDRALQLAPTKYTID